MLTDLAKSRPFRWHRLLFFPPEFLVLLIASAPALLPLSSPGYLQGLDYMDTPWRALELLEALKEGVLFPRWSPDLFYGFGFPIFNFYSPLSFYEVVAMRLLGAADLVQASKITFGVNYLVMGTGTYFLAKQMGLGRRAAATAGILYMYAPLTLRDLYIRSDLASLTGLALLPYTLAAFVYLCRRKSLLSVAVASLLLAAMILTHNLTSVLALGMIVVLVGVHSWWHRDRRVLTSALAAVALGLGLVSFFMIPAIADLPLVHTEKLTSGNLDYRIHFVDPLGNINGTIESRSPDQQYAQTRWGPIDLHPAFPYGLPPIKLSLLQGLLIVGFLTVLATRRMPPVWIAGMGVAGAGLFYLHTTWSSWLWETVPILPDFQFPWRMLAPMGLSIAIMGSWAMEFLPRRFHICAAALLSVAAILAGTWMLPTRLAPFEGGTQVNRDSLIRHEYRERNREGTMVDGQFLPLSVEWDTKTLAFGDILPRYDSTFPSEQWVGQTAFIQPDSKAWISAVRKGQLWMEAQVQAGEDTRIYFHTIYFPGWTAYVDGVSTSIEPTTWQSDSVGRRVALGICQVIVPKGNHLVRIQFEDTPLRRLATQLSMASLLALGAVLTTALWRTRGVKAALILVTTSVVLVISGRMLLSATADKPQWVKNPVVLDLIKDADQQKLEATAPVGGKASDYVHTQDFLIDGETRKVLFMQPPASVSKQLWIPSGAKLQLGIGIDPAVWNKRGDGVEFRVEAVRDNGTTTLLSRYIDPKLNDSDRKWFDFSLDLQPLAGQEVQLKLETLPGSSADYDWAGWSDPRVVLP